MSSCWRWWAENIVEWLKSFNRSILSPRSQWLDASWNLCGCSSAFIPTILFNSETFIKAKSTCAGAIHQCNCSGDDSNGAIIISISQSARRRRLSRPIILIKSDVSVHMCRALLNNSTFSTMAIIIKLFLYSGYPFFSLNVLLWAAVFVVCAECPPPLSSSDHRLTAVACSSFFFISPGFESQIDK